MGVLLIPQSLAYAVLAGLPPVYGLYSSILPLFIYALLASSTKLQIGPVAPTAILINSALNSVVSNAVSTGAGGEEVPTQEYIDAAVALCFLVGVIQLILGAMRFGFIASLLSWPVMSGYTSAAGLIIVASQLRDLLGLTAPGGSAFYERVAEAAANLDTAHWQTCLLGFLALLVLLGIKFVKLPGGTKVPAWFPIQLIVVLLGLGLSAGLDFESSGVAVVGDIPGDVPAPTFPIKSVAQLTSLLPSAVVLAVIAYVGSISLAVIFGKDAGEDVNADLELLASGAACLGGSFFSSFVVSGSFTRTAVNADLGAKTPMAGIVTAALMLGTLLVLAPLFKALPKAVLAAMIISSVKSLLKLQDAKKLYATSTSDFLQMLATFLLTLGLGIDNGIIAAVGLSLALLLYRSFQPRIAQLGRFPGTDVFMDVERFPAAKPVKGLTVLRVDGELHFGNVKLLTAHLVKLHNRALRLRAALGLPAHGLASAPPAAPGGAPDVPAEEGGTDICSRTASDLSHPDQKESRLDGKPSPMLSSVRRRGDAPPLTLAGKASGEEALALSTSRKGGKPSAKLVASNSNREVSFGSAGAAEEVIVFGDPFSHFEEGGEDFDDHGSVTSDTPLVTSPRGGGLPVGSDAVSAIAKHASVRADALAEVHRGASYQATAEAAEAEAGALQRLEAVLQAPPLGLLGLTRAEGLQLLRLRGVVLDGCRIVHVDAHAARELLETIKTFDKGKTGIRIVLASIPGPVRDRLHRLGVLPAVGYRHVHQTVSAAVSALVGKSQYALWTASLASYGQLMDVLIPGLATVRQGADEGGPAMEGGGAAAPVSASTAVASAPQISSLEMDSSQAVLAASREAAVDELT